jgi:hypothetical protein
LGFSLSILNVYGSYEGSHNFWDSLFSSQSIKYDSLVIDGDMNLTLNYREVWGDSVRSDRLVDFFQSHFEASRWVDIEPIKLRPTWNNNRSGQDVVAKILDHFFSYTLI